MEVVRIRRVICMKFPQGQILDLGTPEAEISFVDLTSNDEEE